MSRFASAPGPGPAVASTVPHGRRQAALLLHAMPEDDREWLVAQLAPAERTALRELLAELESLRIPADPKFLELALAGPAAVAGAPGVTVPDGADGVRADAGSAGRERKALSAADPARVAVVLRDEPPQLIYVVFRICEWPWRFAVLQRIGAAKRVEVERRLALDAERTDRGGASASGLARAPALEAQLVRSILNRLAEVCPEPTRAGARGRLSLLVERWRRA